MVPFPAILVTDYCRCRTKEFFAPGTVRAERAEHMPASAHGNGLNSCASATSASAALGNCVCSESGRIPQSWPARGWDVKLCGIVGLPSIAPNGSSWGHQAGDIHNVLVYVLLGFTSITRGVLLLRSMDAAQ
jgi:hypothetical protein